MQQPNKTKKMNSSSSDIVAVSSLARKGVHMPRRQFIYDILCSFLHPHRLLLLRKLIYFFHMFFCLSCVASCSLIALRRRLMMFHERKKNELKLKNCLSLGLLLFEYFWCTRTMLKQLNSNQTKVFEGNIVMMQFMRRAERFQFSAYGITAKNSFTFLHIDEKQERLQIRFHSNDSQRSESNVKRNLLILIQIFLISFF